MCYGTGYGRLESDIPRALYSRGGWRGCAAASDVRFFLCSFLASNTVCDTLRLMSPNSPVPVAIVPGIPDPATDAEETD